MKSLCADACSVVVRPAAGDWRKLPASECAWRRASTSLADLREIGAGLIEVGRALSLRADFHGAVEDGSNADGFGRHGESSPVHSCTAMRQCDVGRQDVPKNYKFAGSAQLPKEPGAGISPMSIDGSDRDSQRRGRFFDRQPREITQFHHLRGLLDPRSLAAGAPRLRLAGSRLPRRRFEVRYQNRCVAIHHHAALGFCGALVRRGCGAWLRRPRRKNGPGCSNADCSDRRPAERMPHGRAPSLGEFGPAFPGPASGPLVSAVRRRPAAVAPR